MGDMVNKTVVFLAVDGFEARAFEALWQCFGWQKNAATRIASFNADDQIISMDGLEYGLPPAERGRLVSALQFLDRF